MAKNKLTLEEAAEYLGISPDELMQTRGRGLEPGRSGYKDKGVLVWNRKDLPKSAETTETTEED
jgi:hypothetical protein